MKRIGLILLGVCIGISLYAQPDSLTSLQCVFVQERHVAVLAEPGLSEGTLLFKSPDKLRWSYTQPMVQGFVMNGGTVSLFNESGLTPSDGRNTRLYTMIGSLITAGITSNQAADAWASSQEFSVQQTEEDGHTVLTMTPLRRDLKKLFSFVRITLVPSGSLAQEILLQEVSGDSTRLTFSHYQLNQPLDDALFE